MVLYAFEPYSINNVPEGAGIMQTFAVVAKGIGWGFAILLSPGCGSMAFYDTFKSDYSSGTSASQNIQMQGGGMGEAWTLSLVSRSLRECELEACNFTGTIQVFGRETDLIPR